MKLRKSVKEGNTLFNAHFKHVVNILTLIPHVKGIAVISLTLADVTLYVNVGKEVHFNALNAVALASLASAAANVKGESARVVAACLCILGLGKEVSDICEQTRVGCGVRARCAPYGALVYGNDLVKMLKSRYPFYPSRVGDGAVKVSCKGAVKHRVDERGFTAARNARHGNELAERYVYVNIFKIVFGGADYTDIFARACSASRGNLYPFSAREISARDRRLGCGDLFRGSACYDLSAVNTCTGADVNYKISLAHSVLVVLNDYNAVAEIAEIFEGGYELSVIALMETNARLVQYIKHARECRAYLSCKPYALSLAPRESSRRSCEVEIIKTYTN